MQLFIFSVLFIFAFSASAMMKSLNTAAAGMTAMQYKMDTISNNIANINTTGYKRARANIQDLTYQTLRDAGTGTSSLTELPTGFQIGTGSKVVGTQRDFNQGSPIITDNPLDLMIQGRGFFQILLPDGNIGYTRDGTFRKDSSGRVVTADGYPLVPEITIPPEVAALGIGSDGIVSVQIPGQNITTVIGQIQITDFINPGGLSSTGRNLYVSTSAAGNPITGVPGQTGLGEIVQQQLEAANVNLVSEMVKMIKVQRSYEMNSKVIQTSDQMLQMAAGLR